MDLQPGPGSVHEVKVQENCGLGSHALIVLWGAARAGVSTTQGTEPHHELWKYSTHGLLLVYTRDNVVIYSAENKKNNDLQGRRFSGAIPFYCIESGWLPHVRWWHPTNLGRFGRNCRSGHRNVRVQHRPGTTGSVLQWVGHDHGGARPTLQS